jgi:lipid A 4'-phosphatase
MPLRLFTDKPRTLGLCIIAALFLVGIAFTVVIDATGRDMDWISGFYEAGGANEGWIHGKQTPWCQLYDYGEIPGILMAVAALALYIAARRGTIRAEYSRPCLVVILTVILGPGLAINGILKSYWGRPRPADVVSLGGNWEFRKVGQIGTPGRGKSFSCGHCSMAFATASVAAFYPMHPVVGAAALMGGIAFGVVTGVARMAQGGHFATDVLWSGVVILSLIAALYYLVFRIPEHEAARRSGAPEPPDLTVFAKTVLILLVFVLPGGIMLTKWPLYKEFRQPIPMPSGSHQLLLRVSPESVALQRKYTADPTEPMLHVVVSGLGSPWARIENTMTTRVRDNAVHVHYKLDKKGFLPQFKSEATLFIPIRKPPIQLHPANRAE